jgi:Ca2+/Na+ antiporter
LAFSNGAPDVISSFAAGGNSEGVPLVIGSIFGAGLFDFTLTTAAVIWTSKDIKAAKTSFIRDIVFYLLAMLYLMLLGLYG